MNSVAATINKRILLSFVFQTKYLRLSIFNPWGRLFLKYCRPVQCVVLPHAVVFAHLLCGSQVRQVIHHSFTFYQHCAKLWSLLILTRGSKGKKIPHWRSWQHLRFLLFFFFFKPEICFSLRQIKLYQNHSHSIITKYQEHFLIYLLILWSEWSVIYLFSVQNCWL